MKRIFFLSAAAVFAVALVSFTGNAYHQQIKNTKPVNDTIHFEGEKHFSNIQQLTFV